MKNINKYLKLFSLLCATAIFFTSCEFNFDKRPESGAAGFVAVTDITGVPTGGMPNVGTPLTATVEPHNATNKRIEWSVKTDGGTQSSIDGSRLTANAEGMVTVTARIENGLAEGEDFTKDFNIQISIVVPYKITDIYDIPAALPIGDYTYTLHGKITPENATHRTIEWSVIDPGTTGATVTPEGFLSADRKGTVTLRATIVNGRLEDGDYTKDFKIDITTGVIASGNYSIGGGDDKACYWIDGEFNELNNASAVGFSRTTGIVEANGKLYIAGHYENDASGNTTICYWLNGVEKTLPGSSGTNGQYNDPWTRCFSIAAGGGYVYIFGQVANGNTCTYYYWKINANNDSATPERVTLTMPSGSNVRLNYSETDMVVKNDGNVVIVSRPQYGAVYYWESGNETSPVRINGLPNGGPYGDYGFWVNDIAVVNNDVYLTGTFETGNDNNRFIPYYYRLGVGGVGDVHVFNNLDGWNNTRNPPVSVIEQNGVPVFLSSFRRYHANYTRYCYWRIGGNLIDIPIMFNNAYDITDTVVSDGDVYAALGSGYMVLREPSFPSRTVTLSGRSYENCGTFVTGIVVMNDNMLLGTVGYIAAPVWRDGEAVSLAAPSVNLYGQAIIEQGWEISDDGDEDWTHFTATTASMSLNGKYLRYYAKGSSGRIYHSNTVAIRVRSLTEREVTIEMWDSYNDGWNNTALRINVNGTDLTPNVTLAPGVSPDYHMFFADKDEEVIIYFVIGSYGNECAFAVYYSDDPPNPAFTPTNGTAVDTSGKLLVYKQYSTMGSIANGAVLGSFTVP